MDRPFLPLSAHFLFRDEIKIGIERSLFLVVCLSLFQLLIVTASRKYASETTAESDCNYAELNKRMF